MPELSVLIPARNEMFLGKTVDNILENIEGDTEIIVVLDGYWPYEPLKDHPRVSLIHHTVPVGQRRGTNEAAYISQAKYIMKIDAHCAVDKGFDVKLMKDLQDHETTVIPRMFNLHAFDWVCPKCGWRKYQGPTPAKCETCDGVPVREIIWKPRLNRRTDFMRFDSNLIFQYWREYEKRPESKGDIVDVMSSVGACWMMTRRRFRKIGGVDERHGGQAGWGQMGTEISLKSQLSGGRQVVNKRTWFAHMFRTQGGDFGFPYPISGKDQEAARTYSRDIWFNNKFKHAIHPLSYVLKKYWPIPGWTDMDMETVLKREARPAK